MKQAVLCVSFGTSVPAARVSITAVEVLQVYTGTGSCDVDDLILNLAGALLVFIVCRVTPLWHRICSVNPRPKK